MSRGFAAAGVCLAGLCGGLIAYSTLQPELERQRAERLGELPPQQDTNEHALSQAIASDFKEARQQINTEKGIAWGLRQAIREARQGKQAVNAPQVPMRNEKEMEESPNEALQKAKPDREKGNGGAQT